MIDWVECVPVGGPPNAPAGGAPREVILSKRGLARDGETVTAAATRTVADAKAPVAGADAKLRRIAADIARSVQARLPGRVCDLKVRVENDQFVLSGVSSSYYVKQVAQHVAMNALDALMLGRLVNEIEVRSVR